jgi:hypothetical protein
MLLIGEPFVVMSDSEISYGLSEMSCARTLSSIHQVHDAIVHRPRPRWPKPGGHHGESSEALDNSCTHFDGRLFNTVQQEAYRTVLALSFTMRQANILLVQNVQQSFVTGLLEDIFIMETCPAHENRSLHFESRADSFPLPTLRALVSAD